MDGKSPLRASTPYPKSTGNTIEMNNLYFTLTIQIDKSIILRVPSPGHRRANLAKQYLEKLLAYYQ